MPWAIDYFFVDGGRRVKLATFFFDGRRIWYEIAYDGRCIDSPYFTAGKLSEQLQNIIELPLVRARLRARTMPGYFQQIQPNTMEHFRAISHDSTYYRFSAPRRLGG